MVMKMDKEKLKEKKRSLRKVLRRMFTRENIIKIVVLISTLALIISSVLPYIL